MSLHLKCNKCKKTDIVNIDDAPKWVCPFCEFEIDALTRDDIACIIYTLKYDVKTGDDYSDIIRKLKKLWKEMEEGKKS